MAGAVQGVDERPIGPGARPAERLAGYATVVVGGVLAGAGAVGAGWSALGVDAFDLFGGAAVNATSAAERHVHRPAAPSGTSSASPPCTSSRSCWPGACRSCWRWRRRR
ncbi:hypothetical protein [Streptomyces sp. NPDC017941]|uniref:hypothetical protein n=1 Tax=Streptomyces sp. NPDC017941 TaxID=3365018 RepID=UPI00379A3FC1